MLLPRRTHKIKKYVDKLYLTRYNVVKYIQGVKYNGTGIRTATAQKPIVFSALCKIVSAYTPYLKPLGLTYTQYVVLMVLWEKESVNVGQLGSTLHLDAGTLTPLLKRFEKDGYITRERSKEDERITVLNITAKGNALKKKCKDIPSKIAKTIKSLSKEDATKLYELLYKFLEEENE